MQRLSYAAGSYPSYVAVGDFNNDKRLDFVTANFYSNDVSVFIGYKELVFSNIVTQLSIGNESRPRSLACADLNNDKIMDIITANSGTNSIGVFLGHGNLSFTSATVFSRSPCSIAAGDFDNDTRVDIVFASCNSDYIGVLLGNGDGSFKTVMNYSTGFSSSSHRSLSIKDMNNDTKLDILVTNFDSSTIGVFLGYGNGTFSTTMISFQLGYQSNPIFAAVGDFNSDKKLDIAVINNDTDSLNILLQTC